MKKILVTGANGFIGKALVKVLLKNNFIVSVLVRKKNIFPKKVNVFQISNFYDATKVRAAFDGVDCIVHLAGQAHKVHIDSKNEMNKDDEIRRINTTFTVELAKYAVKCGVKRFIFLSSISVNGIRTENFSFSEKDLPNPQDPYSLSKYEAEQGLIKVSKNNDLKIVIIRAPLVYGLNAKGNFARLLKWASSKNTIPLPLGNINNLRSFIALDNLIDFIITCILNPKAINQIFLISDDEKYSTTEFIKIILKLFNKKARLFSFPQSWILLLSKLFGKEEDALRLISSLEIDSSKARKLLGWKAVTNMDIELKKNEKNI